ncbi:MAG: hypothetical protein MUF21_11250 [Gemmatimonadaceae bacterium]|nr:hypothetical protein [Gemmatimonadaceae bacterium]
MRRLLLPLAVIAAVPAHAQRARAPRPAAAAPAAAIDTALLGSLRYRSIGPSRGGRSTTIAGVAGQPMLFYMGSTGGGVWKTEDAGHRWTPISDGSFGGSIGAIDVADSDPNVIYVGTGSQDIRGNTSTGRGLWKSTDAGKTWKFMGLEQTGAIGRIVVHPTNPELVYASALGHPFGKNRERGIYRSKDGGASWQQVLFVNDSTGASDLAMHPRKAQAVDDDLRRPGGRRLSEHRWRRQLAEARRWAPDRDRRQGGRRRVARESRSRLGDGRGGAGRRPLSQRRRRHDVDARERREQDPPARVVLLPPHRAPDQRERGLGDERAAASLGGRRQDVRGGAGAARRHARPVDQPAESPDHGARRRRRRGGLAHRASRGAA